MSPFAENSRSTEILAKDVVQWTQQKSRRLLLPTIQRSLVWRNDQILSYWDSLLRGYPAGLMMVHRSRTPDSGESAKARNTDGTTLAAEADDFQLFDGQQRLSTLLLGYDHGQLSKKLKIWIDLGVDPETSSGLLFQLRISNSGQPFGYQPANPNQKPSLGRRREKIAEWKRRFDLDHFDPREAFQRAQSQDLLDGVCPFPLHEAITSLLQKNAEAALNFLLERYPEIPRTKLSTFLNALERALERPILFQLIDDAVIAEESEYIRFFDRLGRGGSPLSQDELTYSIIKHRYPYVHDRMREIMEGNSGRLTSEVNLVLASIRISKVVSGWTGKNIWEVIGRPNPSFVSKLNQVPEVEAEFLKLIPPASGGKLVSLLTTVREQLAYDPDRNPTGLPVILLARIPHQLVDVLLLLTFLSAPSKGENQLPAFALYWMLFVSDSEKAATQIFRLLGESPPKAFEIDFSSWIKQFEEDGIAHLLTHPSQLSLLRNQVQQGNYQIRNWSERFTAIDTDDQNSPGNSLRILSTNRELIKRALLWTQRAELSTSYKHFDPTSTEDEDLPIDLDHLIPHSRFAFDWRSRDSFLTFDDTDENFRHHRKLIGNSLGNFRWLDASDNRSRGAGLVETDFNRKGVEGSEAPWNQLIKKSPWDREDVSNFQKLIDQRTINLFSTILEESGISQLVDPPLIQKQPILH